MMRYFYTAAWVVVGGISLRQDSSPRELASSKDYRFLLTRDPDAFLSGVDESSAIGRLISAVLSRTVAAGLVVLGEMSLHGVLGHVEGLGDKLRVAMDSGARRVMIPTADRKDFATIIKQPRMCLNFRFAATKTFREF